MSGVRASAVHSATVKIGGLPIQLRTDDPRFMRIIEQRYTSFLNGKEAADMRLTFDLVSVGRVSTEEDIRVVRDGPRWTAERADFRLEWHSEQKCGRVRQSVNPYSLDGTLRILHSIVLAQQGGFLLHAASAVRNGRACLFFGPSGAGKTTLARLVPPDARLLSDEISYVRRQPSGYFAYGTPFSGELAEPGENISAPIAALYRLVQAPANRVTPMSYGDAIRALLGCVLFFAEDPELVNRVFTTICDLVGSLPVYELEFVPDASVWDVIP